MTRTTLGMMILTGMLIFPAAVYADSISGTCKNSSGEKCLKSNHTISTSWNSEKGYPDSNGDYKVDLGGAVNSTITVYCDGKSVGKVKVAGDTTFNVVCR